MVRSSRTSPLPRFLERIPDYRSEQREMGEETYHHRLCLRCSYRSRFLRSCNQRIRSGKRPDSLLLLLRLLIRDSDYTLTGLTKCLVSPVFLLGTDIHVCTSQSFRYYSSGKPIHSPSFKDQMKFSVEKFSDHLQSQIRDTLFSEHLCSKRAFLLYSDSEIQDICTSVARAVTKKGRIAAQLYGGTAVCTSSPERSLHTNSPFGL